MLAWGVEGFVVSFIAPHSLTAGRSWSLRATCSRSTTARRARSTSRSTGARPGVLGPGDAITASFLREAADLAQVPGSSFYRRLRQKFGRLAS